MGSASACASEVASQIDQQLFCVRSALSRSEPQGVGYMRCTTVSLDRAWSCFEALPSPGCTTMDACAVPEAEEADCRLLLTAEQRDALDGCRRDEDTDR
jgi:hypothetical protein